VDGTALQQVVVHFDQNVVVPADAVTVRTNGHGVIDSVSVSPLAQETTIVTIAFPAVTDDRLTLTLHHVILGADEMAMDGEIDDSQLPILPSGNGAPGGPAVFQFSVLQGDVNRDGVVESVDFSLLNAAVLVYDRDADLNGDGRVDGADQSIVLGNAGAFIPMSDGNPPMVLSITPSSIPLPTGTVVLTFGEPVDPATLDPRTVYMVGADGTVLNASGEPVAINATRYSFPFEHIACEQDYLLWISNAIADLSGELLVPPTAHLLLGEDRTVPRITCPEVTYVNSTEVFSIPAGDIPHHAAIQIFLDSAEATDECSDSESIEYRTSLDTPTLDLPLGVNHVVFVATDEAGNSASCDAMLIVVPAIPWMGPIGPVGPEGPAGEDATDGNGGADGADGVNGQSCWDLNGNGLEDANEDRNGDLMVNVLDCQGLQGEPGLPGEEGPPGPSGAAGVDGANGADGAAGGLDGSAGQPLPDKDTGSRGRMCGAVGMLPYAFMIGGLTLMRGSARRIRMRP
jgi:hypothetical protein